MAEVGDGDFFEGDRDQAAVGRDPVAERAEREAIRIAEALVFASAEPVSENFIAERLPRGIDVKAIMHA